MQSVEDGATAAFTIKPDGGYRVVVPVGGTCGGSYTGDPADSTNGITYTTNAVTADCTVEASFTPNQYTLTVEPLFRRLRRAYFAEGNDMR